GFGQCGRQFGEQRPQLDAPKRGWERPNDQGVAPKPLQLNSELPEPLPAGQEAVRFGTGDPNGPRPQSPPWQNFSLERGGEGCVMQSLECRMRVENHQRLSWGFHH